VPSSSTGKRSAFLAPQRALTTRSGPVRAHFCAMFQDSNYTAALRGEGLLSDINDTVRSLWDIKSGTYDNSTGHHPRSAIELAAWSAAARRLLPAPPARVLDVGAGTGFLTLMLARQGYEVTALDLSTQMLSLLASKAAKAGFAIRTIEGDAAAPPKEGFDAVVERHVLWTLPEPRIALDGWRDAAPAGRLVVFASEWGSANGTMTRARSKARELLRRARQECPDDHSKYDSRLRSQLPLAHGTTPQVLVTLVEASRWGPARIERLRDVDWAARRMLPSVVDRVIGVPPHFAVVAG
jgi:2-polyprenyl-3-methyl-5-hydroxy-6-metoxy-1,4-benzoquinol methylase